MQSWLVLSAALLPFACNSGNTGTLTGQGPHGPPPDGSSSGPGDDGSVDSAGGNTDDSSSPVGDDGGPMLGSQCDPQNDTCPSPTMCCLVHGNVREGGVYYSCQNTVGTPPACP
jgi:hypothetical protein